MNVTPNSVTIVSQPEDYNTMWHRVARALWWLIFCIAGSVAAILFLSHCWIYIFAAIVIFGSAAGKGSGSSSYPGRYKVKVW